MSVDREFRVRIVTTSETAGAQQVAASLGKVGAAASMVNVRHKEWKDIIKGVASQFPGLAAAGRLALNPITLAVAGIAGSFSIWRSRVDGLTRALANLELPQGKAMDPGHVSALAAAWGKYAEAVDRLREQAADEGKQIATNLERLKLELDLRLKLVEARTKADAAEGKAEEALGGKRGHGTRSELAMANVAAFAQLDAQTVKEDAELQAMLDTADADLSSAAKKRAEAAKIRIASADDDAKTEAELAEQAKVAEEDIRGRRERASWLREASFSPWSPKGIWNSFKAARTYGLDMTPEGAATLEESGIPTAQIAINRYRSFARDRQFRDEVRRRRESLLGDAAKLQVGGETAFYDDYPAAAEQAGMRRRAGEEVVLTGALERTFNAQSEGTRQLEQLANEMNQQVRATGRAKQATMDAYRQQQEFNAEMTRVALTIKAQIENLSRQFKGSR